MFAWLVSCYAAGPSSGGASSAPSDSGGIWYLTTGGTGGVAGTLPTTDSGAGRPACDPGVAALQRSICAETDAGDYSDPYQDLRVPGTVTEVGGALAKVPGSAAIGDFSRCGADDAQQVRLVDAYGHQWTVGWDVEGSLDDASADAILPGAALSLTVRSGRTNPNVVSVAFVLADSGPLALVEQVSGVPLLTDAERGGIGAEVAPYDQGCFGPDASGAIEILQTVAFTGPSGTTTLESGQSTTVALADREVALVLAEASQPAPGGADGGLIDVWVAWAAP